MTDAVGPERRYGRARSRDRGKLKRVLEVLAESMGDLRGESEKRRSEDGEGGRGKERRSTEDRYVESVCRRLSGSKD